MDAGRCFRHSAGVITHDVSSISGGLQVHGVSLFNSSVAELVACELHLFAN